jgi:tetratricopeptide (TPR) repeat protein
MGALTRAERVTRALLEDPSLGSPDAATLGLLARICAALNNRPEATRLLDRIGAEFGPSAALVERAQYLLIIGDDQGAATAFRQILSDDPADRDASAGLLRALARSGTADEFRTALVTAARVSGSQYAEFTRETPVLVAMVRDAQLRSLAAFAVDAPETLTAIVATGRAVLTVPDRRRPTIDAVAAAGRLADALPYALPPKLVHAELLGQCEEFDTALVVAARAEREFPLSVEPIRLRAQILAAKGDWSAALDAGLKWRSLGRLHHSEVDTLIAESRIRLGDVAAGLAEIEPYLKPAQEHPERFERLLVAYGWGLLLQGNDKRASEFVESFWKDDARWRDIALGYEVFRIPDADAAVRWLDALERRVGKADTSDLLRLALQWQRLAIRSGAVEHRTRFEGLAQRVGESAGARARDHFNLALMFDELGDTARASDAYRRALSADPKLHDARNNLAVIALVAGQWEQAVELARQAVMADPRNTEYLDTLAAAYVRGSRSSDAIESLQRAREIEPSEARWNVTLAETLLLAGRVEEARTEAQRAGERLGIAKFGADSPRAGLRDRLFAPTRSGLSRVRVYPGRMLLEWFSA